MQDSRRRIWLDARNQQYGSFTELNAWLSERCQSLWNSLRHPEFKEFSIAEMLEQEQVEMMPTGWPRATGWPSPTFANLGLCCRGAEPKLGVNVEFLLILGREDAA